MIFYIFFLFPVSDLKHLVKICRRLYTKNKKGEGQMKFKNYILKKVEKLTRKEVEKIDSKALKEAVINAIVHNDYSYGNTPIIELYSDRIEITSAGGLPQELSQEEFLEGVTAPRNKELIRVFKDVDLIENIGSGVLRILDAYDKSCFKFMDHFLRVSFKYKENPFEYDTEQVKPNKITEQDKPNKKEDKINLILEFCKEPKSVKEIMEYIGLKHRPTFMYDYLNPLLEKDKLQMTIPDKPKSRNQKYVTILQKK